MNREETISIMAVLKAAYPNYYKDMKRGDAEAIIALWTSMFSDEPAEVVAVAVKAHIASDVKGFPPHIGAIKAAIGKIKSPDEMTEIEAWNYVVKAIRNSNYNSREEFEKLPPIVQRLVGSPNQLREWAMMDSETVNSVISSNFQRSYKARATSEREFLALPQDVRQTMEQLASGFAMQSLTDGADQERVLLNG